MTALSEIDVEMQALSGASDQPSGLKMPGGDLNEGENVTQDAPDGGSGDPSFTRKSSQRSSKKGRSRKSKSSDSPVRSGNPLLGTATLPQDPGVGGPTNTINVHGVTEGDEVTRDEQPGKSEQSDGEALWAKFAQALDGFDLTIMDAGKDSIDSLLVFAGLFSAVVTAFCILSLALLQPDPTDSMAVILAQISQQLGSLSIDAGHITSIQPPYTPPARFRATTPQITVNVLWFSSLIIALISASLGIIVKQWLRDYVATTSSLPLEHVCIRQHRFDGLRRWRVNAIMRLLPLLLQISLLLFFVGLSILLWTISTPVAAVGTVLVAMWLAFWWTSICLPTFYADCPYRSAESTIFFALVQSAKSLLHTGITGLADYLCSRVFEPQWLHARLERLSKLKRQAYDSWRDREKRVVQEDVKRLALRTVMCADEFLMDDSILEVAIGAYVKSSELDESVDLLLNFFSKTSGLSEDELTQWYPDSSRRTRSLVGLTLDTLSGTSIAFQYIDPLSRSATRRELLLCILGNYLRLHGAYSQLSMKLLDLPLHVDCLGASISALSNLSGTLLSFQTRGTAVKFEAIDSLSRCAVHAYDHAPEDYDYGKFIDLCRNLLSLLWDASHGEIRSPQVVRHTLIAIRKAVTVLKERWNGVRASEHINISEYMLKVIKRHPALKPGMRDCVMALLEMHTDPSPDTPPLEYIYQVSQYHREVLHTLWGLYNDSPPPPLPLVPYIAPEDIIEWPSL